VSLVRAAPVVEIARVLTRSGVPTERLADRVGIPRDALRDPEFLLPLHLSGVFVEAAARGEGVEDLGFRASEQSGIASMGAFGDLLLRAGTLRDAIGVWSRTREIFNSGARVWLRCVGERGWLHQALDPRMREGRREAEQFWAIKALQLVRAIAGGSAVALILDLREPVIPGLREPALFANVDVRFDQPLTGLGFPRALLDQRFGAGVGAREASPALEQALVASRPGVDFASSVRQVVSGKLGAGRLEVGEIADAIGISVRTLQRRLAEAGASHSRLVDDARFERALEKLAGTTASITAVSAAVGYTDLANFTHAFRRWTGVSPREFRRRRLAPSPPAPPEAPALRAPR
jgi:AraC-like DNA-binding protein